MHDHTFHRGQTCGHVFCIGVRLQDILPLAIQRLERAVDGGVQHVWNAQAGFRIDFHAPSVFENRAHFGQFHMAITGQFMRE